MRRFALALALLLACAPWARVAQAYQARHVVIVVIDGARFSETFGDPGFANVPRMGLDLAALGCRAESRNQGFTLTIPGHAAVLSGTYQPLANDGSERPHQPTLFEYCRAATGAPDSSVWFFSNKEKLGVMSHSDHPAYGEPLAARVNADCVGDAGVVTAAAARLLADRPAIVALNLADTDLAGHSGDWEGYLGAIRTADSLVHHLWTLIQADTGLAGRTALIVTNDHGRHDDEHGGFEGHGDGCPGCRRLLLLALGPDFKAGWVPAAPVQQVDVVPTVALLLGFDAPHASGLVMNDLLLVPHVPIDADARARQGGLRFGAPVPNPTRRTVSLGLDVPFPGVLRVDVLDAQGRRVATLEQGAARPGHRIVTWSGRTQAGPLAAPGAYLVRARLAGRQAAARVVLR